MSKSSKRLISHSEISLTARDDTSWGYFITSLIVKNLSEKPDA